MTYVHTIEIYEDSTEMALDEITRRVRDCLELVRKRWV